MNFIYTLVEKYQEVEKQHCQYTNGLVRVWKKPINILMFIYGALMAIVGIPAYYVFHLWPLGVLWLIFKS